jgi:putative tricarboxylic transport membrane protein
MDVLAGALALILEPFTLLVILAAAFFGVLIGSVPGLTATMATALLVPLTFVMEPVPAIAAIVVTATTAIFAGDIPGCLLRIPGTPASAAYVDEAYRLRNNDQVEVALGANLACSVIGGLIGAVVLALAAPWLAELALNFSTFEYFWLSVLGLSCAVIVSQAPLPKAFLSLLLGLFLTTIGIDLVRGYPRFTFGHPDLTAGIGIIPALIDMFAISEIMRKVADEVRGTGEVIAPARRLLPAIWPTLRRYRLNVARGGLIGALVGCLPGAGADIAAWMSYAVGRRFSREPEKYGTGHVEAIVDGASANNSSLAGAYIPAMVFGIPGDTITAIVIGVLMIKGLTPGPMIFLQQAELVYAIFIVFFLGNILLFFVGALAIRLARHVVTVSPGNLYPVILLFCIVGAYAVGNSTFDVYVMLGLGIIGYLMEENGFPIAPCILGLVLGGIVEQNLVASLIRSGGSFLFFFHRPLAAVLGVLAILVWTAPLALWAVRRLRGRPGPG